MAGSCCCGGGASMLVLRALRSRWEGRGACLLLSQALAVALQCQAACGGCSRLWWVLTREGALLSHLLSSLQASKRGGCAAC